ncbi:MAG: PKD domain-containing protein [Candidatus Aquicultorales bacterium]
MGEGDQYQIDWGDGTIDGSLTHSYSSPGEYQVTIIYSEYDTQPALIVSVTGSGPAYEEPQPEEPSYPPSEPPASNGYNQGAPAGSSGGSGVVTPGSSRGGEGASGMTQEQRDFIYGTPEEQSDARLRAMEAKAAAKERENQAGAVVLAGLLGVVFLIAMASASVRAYTNYVKERRRRMGP